MIKRNNGLTEQEILQNRFTALVTVSIERARIDYLRKEKSRNRHAFQMDSESFDMIPDSTDFVEEICEADSLAYALKQLDERERYVIIARVIEERSFEEIADELGLKYKGVAALYYRTTAKLRDILGGN